MPRVLCLAFASKSFRNIEQLKQFTQLSNNGNEVCFVTSGDASTSEGHFWEAINAAGVLQIPLAVFIWDDGYGISVPIKYQTIKGSISAALRGMQKRYDTNGIEIYNVKGWDYAGMCEVFESGLQKIRETHVPAVIHVIEVTQPQGHSTSGSQERYKSKERLEWETEFDCIKKMREWMIAQGIASTDELERFEREDIRIVREAQRRAWAAYRAPIDADVKQAIEFLERLGADDAKTELQKIQAPF